MKSEHRHELQQHDLAKIFESKVGPFFEANGAKILIGLVVVVVLIIGFSMWTNSSSQAVAEGWTQLASCQTTEEFANVAERFSGSDVGMWARLNEADGHLRAGIPLMFSDRKGGEDELAQAKDAYGKLLEAGGVPAQIRERALFGMARCLEATSAGDTAEAVQAYQRLLSEFPASVYRKKAEDQVEALQTGSVQDFYAWFEKQDPKPADLETPRDGAAGASPMNFPITLPQVPEALQLSDEERAKILQETATEEPIATEPAAPASDSATKTETPAETPKK